MALIISERWDTIRFKHWKRAREYSIQWWPCHLKAKMIYCGGQSCPYIVQSYQNTWPWLYLKGWRIQCGFGVWGRGWVVAIMEGSKVQSEQTRSSYKCERALGYLLRKVKTFYVCPCKKPIDNPPTCFTHTYILLLTKCLNKKLQRLQNRAYKHYLEL